MALRAPPLLLLLCVCGARADTEILPEGPLDALAGTTGTFKTLLKQPTFMVMVWNFNDGTGLNPIITKTSAVPEPNVDDKYTGRATINENGTMTLSALTTADSGEYSISIIDSLGNTQSAEIELRVMEPVSDVVITPNVPEARELNTKVELTCTAKGSFLTFQWLNGTKAITPDNTRVTLKNEDTSSKLSFASVYRTDLVGPLFCGASNALSSGKSDPFSLAVHYGPEQVTLSPVSPPPFVASGSNFSLTCSASSSPAAVFSWKKDDRAIPLATATLELKDIVDAKGVQVKTSYTCSATNGKTGTTVDSKPVTFTVIDKVEGVTMTGPTEKLMAGNSSASLVCKAAKGSMQTVAWKKDGSAVAAGGRFSVVDNTTLLISPTQKEDNGVFTCQISNPVSKQEAQVKLTVYYGPEAVKVTGDVAVEVTDKVELVCSASSVPPANYTWKLNGTTLPVTTSTYTIDRAKYTDTGTYTCQATNTVTQKTASKDHSLSVKEEGALDEGLSDGAIAGIVIGVLAAVAIAIGLFLYCRQKVPVESPY